MLWSLPGFYGTSPTRHTCMARGKRHRSASASIADVAAYFLKFQYLTNAFAWLRRPHAPTAPPTELYQNYLANKERNPKRERNRRVQAKSQLNAHECRTAAERDRYMKFLEDAIFGSPEVVDNLEYLVVKRHNKGLVPKLLSSETRRPSEDILRHNMEKVIFYEQNQACSTRDNIFVSILYCVQFAIYSPLLYEVR